MNKYSLIFILIAVLLGGVVVWQQQKINSLEEQVALNTLNALKEPDADNTPPATATTPSSPSQPSAPSSPSQPTEPSSPSQPSTPSVPQTIGSTLPVLDAKAKMDATVLASLGETEITGDVVAVDSANANIFYFTAHGKDADGRATSFLYKYNGDTKKMAAWYWERTTSRFWIVGTDATKVLWIKVAADPTADPCWQKWLQPVEALDVKDPKAGTTTFTVPANILEQANKDQKVCKLVNP